MPEIILGKITTDVLKGLVYLKEQHNILHRGENVNKFLHIG